MTDKTFHSGCNLFVLLSFVALIAAVIVRGVQVLH
jgi:hypothetical protein